ncbi:MAG: hypothetical protein KatS3mg076_0463 [Candidatus Binatia bacterium]|nr:MAG: hypothetical protein KatS3mg076_0463 [Candidatus Binatia bacterium]
MAGNGNATNGRPANGSRFRPNGNGNGNGNGYALQEQIRDVLHVLFKRWRLFLTLFLLVSLPGLVLVLLREPLYVATAKVLITTQRADITIQPTDLTRLTTINLNESVVNSEVHIIRSRELLERVVEKLNGNGAVRRVRARTENGGDQDKSRGVLGRQVLRLADSLQVTPIRNSNVIQIDYYHPKARQAALVVNRVVDEYLAYHALVHGAKGLARFYEEQRRSLQDSLARAERALREFSVREGIVDPEAEIQAAVLSISKTEQELREVRAAISGLEERLRTTERQVASEPPDVKWYEYVEVNPVVEALTEQLAVRKADRIALLRKYTEKERHVRDATAEIRDLGNELEQELAKKPTVPGRQILRRNPVRDDRVRELLELQGKLQEARARRASLEEQLSRLNRQLVRLKAKSLEYDRLLQEVRNWRNTYELYIKREEEARVSEAMDQEKMVNVEVVQRPALPLPRTGRRQASTLVALLSGLVVAAAGTFGVEYFGRTIRSERDVERFLGLPALGSLPEVGEA